MAVHGSRAQQGEEAFADTRRNYGTSARDRVTPVVGGRVSDRPATAAPLQPEFGSVHLGFPLLAPFPALRGRNQQTCGAHQPEGPIERRRKAFHLAPPLRWELAPTCWRSG